MLGALDPDPDAEPDADGEPSLGASDCLGPNDIGGWQYAGDDREQDAGDDRELDLDLQEGDEGKEGDSDLKPDDMDGIGEAAGEDRLGADEPPFGGRQVGAYRYVPPPSRLRRRAAASICNVGPAVGYVVDPHDGRLCRVVPL